MVEYGVALRAGALCALRLGLPCAGDTAGRLSTLDHLPFPPDGDFNFSVGGHGLGSLET
jgi:hypothetical protein